MNTHTAKEKMRGNMRGVIEFAVYALLLVSVFFGGLARVPTASMAPTIQPGERLIYQFTTAEKLDYDDIVLFFPRADKPSLRPVNAVSLALQSHDDSIFVKRLIGKPGDTLEIHDGFVFRNGEMLDPDYLKVLTAGENEIYTVPEGQYFFMGDNRQDSFDSRIFGSVPADRIFAKCVFHFSPILSGIFGKEGA